MNSRDSQEWLTSAGSHVGQSLSLGDVGSRDHRRNDRNRLADDSRWSQFAGNSRGGGDNRGRSLGAGYCAWVSQSVSKSAGLEELLTDVSRSDCGNDFGSRRLERGVHRSNYGGRGRGPGRRLVLRGCHNAGDRLG